MQSNIKINNNTTIDLAKLIASKLLIQANSGGGKSWLIRRLVEQAYGKVQIIIIDPEGEFSTLREKYDFVLAGKGGDTPAEPRSAALLARKLLELEVSAIIDLYELHPQERKHFVKLFLESMVNAPKELYHDVIVVLDEAHMFVPEKDESEAASAVIDLASRGRKRGFCAVLATQRISKLAKDAAAECNNKLIGRTSLDIDRKRAADELGITSKEEVLALRSLSPGEFFAFGPAISSEVIKVKVGEVHTSVPKAGSLMRVVPPTEKIKKILAKLADLPQEAQKEAKTMADLKSEITQLKRHRCPVVKNDPSAITHAILKRDKEWEKIVGNWKTYASTFHSAMKIAWDKVNVSAKPSDKPSFTMTPSNIETLMVEIKTPPSEKIFQMDTRNNEYSGDRKIGLCERKIYSFLHLNRGKSFSKIQLGVITGYSPNSGGFNNALGKLNSMGLIKRNGAKISFGSEDESLVIGGEEYTPEIWFNKLGKCEREIFKVLWENRESTYSKEDLGQLTGYQATSGGFNNSLGKLNSTGLLIRSNGRISFNPELLEI